MKEVACNSMDKDGEGLKMIKYFINCFFLINIIKDL